MLIISARPGILIGIANLRFLIVLVVSSRYTMVGLFGPDNRHFRFLRASLVETVRAPAAACAATEGVEASKMLDIE